MLLINGKGPVPPKVKTWRELETFNPLANGNVDVEGTLQRIALVYGTDIETVAENLDLADLLPTFIECIKYVNGVVLEKLQDVPKNVEGRNE